MSISEDGKRRCGRLQGYACHGSLVSCLLSRISGPEASAPGDVTAAVCGHAGWATSATWIGEMAPSCSDFPYHGWLSLSNPQRLVLLCRFCYERRTTDCVDCCSRRHPSSPNFRYSAAAGDLCELFAKPRAVLWVQPLGGLPAPHKALPAVTWFRRRQVMRGLRRLDLLVRGTE